MKSEDNCRLNCSAGPVIWHAKTSATIESGITGNPIRKAGWITHRLMLCQIRIRLCSQTECHLRLLRTLEMGHTTVGWYYITWPSLLSKFDSSTHKQPSDNIQNGGLSLLQHQRAFWLCIRPLFSHQQVFSYLTNSTQGRQTNKKVQFLTGSKGRERIPFLKILCRLYPIRFPNTETVLKFWIKFL